MAAAVMVMVATSLVVVAVPPTGFTVRRRFGLARLAFASLRVAGLPLRTVRRRLGPARVAFASPGVAVMGILAVRRVELALPARALLSIAGLRPENLTVAGRLGARPAVMAGVAFSGLAVTTAAPGLPHLLLAPLVLVATLVLIGPCRE